MLAGHGETGHIFDDFAPLLSRDFHVFALTRRGFGASRQPAQGYDLATMVRDIAKVVDALNLPRTHLAGHSIAGDEMTRFALSYPSKLGKLIYLDAAYDRVEAQRVEKTFPKLPRSEPTPSDLVSPKALQAFIARTETAMPEAEIRATRVFDANGHYLRDVTPNWIVTAVAQMVEHPNYKQIRASMLAVYAVYKKPVQLLPRYSTADPGTRSAMDKIFDIWQTFAREQRDDFRKAAPHARVVEVDGASHYVFISQPGTVLEEIRKFLRAPE